MFSRILKNVSVVLWAVGLIGGAITTTEHETFGFYPAILEGIALVSGVALMWRSPRAALWVSSVAAFICAATAVVMIAAPLFQPLDLSITEIRLDPAAFAIGAASAVAVLCLAAWVLWQLGRPAIRDEIMVSGIRRWDMRMPAQAGAGAATLVAFLLWAALHGQSADLATSIALQQLGPDYRYHLSWISSRNNGHGSSVTGVVTAWNRNEIKKVLLHWETR